MTNFFYVVDSGTRSNIAMFSDVQSLANAKQISSPYKVDNPLLKALFKLHTSIKVNKAVDLPLKRIWDKYSVLQPVDNVLNWVVVTNWSVRRFSLQLLKKLQNDRRYKLVLLYLDTYATVPDFYKAYINQVKFDLIYTFDINDAKQYGWIYTNSIYSISPIKEKPNPEFDICFAGEDKGRMQSIIEIYEFLSAHGVKCNFKIITPKKDMNDREGLHFLKNRIVYSEILDDISNSHAILEYVQQGQSGMTMRPYEAMFYNKKFLTNNAVMSQMPFFNRQYMMHFSELNKEIVEFLKNRDAVDYHYENEYSPCRWLEGMPRTYERKSENQ